ncbi:MAG: hypothetical protein AAGH15_21750 [Myxococcota bacterium]
MAIPNRTYNAYGHETRARILVEVATLSTSIPDATKDGRPVTRLARGTHEIEVPESVLDALQESVQKPRQVKAAKERCARLTAEHAAKMGTADMAPFSVAGCHRDLYGKDLGRFAALEVLETGLPPRPTAADAHMANMAAYVARAMDGKTFATGAQASATVEPADK